MSDTLESTIPPRDDIAEREARADAARMTRYFMMFAAPLLIMFVILIGAFAWKLSHPKIAAPVAAATADKDAEIVVYCANTACQSSIQTAQALEALGYTRVKDYEAGKQDWIEAGLPVESGAPAEVA